MKSSQIADDKHDSLTLEAMASADASIVIAHRDVLARADSLSINQPLPTPAGKL
jgi:hypothetical protein